MRMSGVKESTCNPTAHKVFIGGKAANVRFSEFAMGSGANDQPPNLIGGFQS
jgi:hypothetical protein